VGNRKCDSRFDKVTIGKAEKWLVDAAKKVGLDIDGFKHEITNDFVSHVRKHHAHEKFEAERGQVAIKEADFGRIPKLIKAPDYAIVGARRDNKNFLIYAKKTADGTMLYFEEILAGRKNRALRGKTLFKIKGDIDEKKLASIVTLNGKTDISRAKKIASEMGGHSHDKDV